MIVYVALGKQVSIIKAVPESTQKAKRTSPSRLIPEWAWFHSYGESWESLELADWYPIKTRCSIVHYGNKRFYCSSQHNHPIILPSEGTLTGEIAPNTHNMPQQQV